MLSSLRLRGSQLRRGLVAQRGFQSLPIIDVAALLDPSASDKAKASVAAQLNRACTNVGFFYIREHGVPAGVHQGVLAEAREWFALPREVKERLRLTPERNFRGYQALGANVTRYDGGFQRDWHEAIDLYREVDHTQASVGRSQWENLPASPVHGINQWPSQRPSFERALRLYIDHMLGVGAAVMRGIALGMGLPESFFAGERAGDSYWVVRVIHYPPLAQDGADAGSSGDVQAALDAGGDLQRSVRLSCGEHTDYGLLTLVNQEQHMAALQVKNQDGRWITAEPLDGAFVCNIGDMLRIWSNGRYTPTMHRVINADAQRSRVSVPFFFEPNFGAEVAPPEALLRGEPPRERGVMYGAHLERKVLGNFELE